MARARSGSRLGAAYVLIGAALLGAALFAPWYFFDSHYASGGSGNSTFIETGNTTFYLVSLPGSAPVQSTCYLPANPLCMTGSYGAVGLNATVAVVDLVLGLAVVGFAAAVVSGLLGWVGRARTRTVAPEAALAGVALALTAGAVAGFALLLPPAFAHDIPSSQTGLVTGGPWTSFFGFASPTFTVACPGGGCEFSTTTWGPGIGWALALAATMVLAVGAAMMVRFRHDVGEPSPSAGPSGQRHEAGSPDTESSAGSKVNVRPEP